MKTFSKIKEDIKKVVYEMAFGKGKMGSGSRFKACVASGKSPELCAYIGRKRYGKKKFTQMSVKGRKH